VSKKSGKSQALDTIKQLMRTSRKKIDKIAKAAARWWMTAHGRRIKAGAVKEVIRSWERGRFRPPAWLTEYARRGDTSVLFV